MSFTALKILRMKESDFKNLMTTDLFNISEAELLGKIDNDSPFLKGNCSVYMYIFFTVIYSPTVKQNTIVPKNW